MMGSRQYFQRQRGPLDLQLAQSDLVFPVGGKPHPTFGHLPKGEGN